MEDITPFGLLVYPNSVERKRIEPVLRALDWCETILSCTDWIRVEHQGHCSLQRTINEQRIELFPLQAAAMDLGYKTRFKKQHLPIHLNEAPVCVRSTHNFPRPMHTDMLASLMLLLGHDDFEPEVVPRTLHPILTADQLANLPSLPSRRLRYIAGAPSTSGRMFLPEAQVLELLNLHPKGDFRVQFEKRDGTLRNMTARLAAWERAATTENAAGEHEANPARPMNYNPDDYSLTVVLDADIGHFRLLARDRITEMTIGNQTYRTESAESS
jgi:hypothetical protein